MLSISEKFSSTALPTLMNSEEVLKLFDFYWFEHGIFEQTSPSVTDQVFNAHEEPQPPKLSRIPALINRSFSDQALSSKDSSSSDFPSPKSVLLTPKLQTILSGKEVGEFEEAAARKGGLDVGIEKRGSGRMMRRRRKGSSRSLSELEFEELKGFMDLGFVFSDEDKDSRLVSIIPGLQRLGRKVEGCDELGEKSFDESAVSRPYLSEAWEALEKKKADNPLMNWRIPAFGNEMELKDHLRLWAHTVASTVR